MRRAINVTLGFLLLVSFIYTISSRYVSHKYKYCFVYPGYINTPNNKMPVFLGGSDIGYVTKIISFDENHDQCMFILRLKNILDAKHIYANIVTINFLSQEQIVVLEWNNDTHDLEPIESVPQVSYKPTFKERFVQVFSKIDIQDIVNICKNMNSIVVNLKDSSDALIKFINSLDEDILNTETQKRLVQDLLSTLSNLNIITHNIRELVSQKNYRNIESAITSMSNTFSEINHLVKSNKQSIQKSARTINACVKEFSKSPLRFLKTGLRQN